MPPRLVVCSPPCHVLRRPGGWPALRLGTRGLELWLEQRALRLAGVYPRGCSWRQTQDAQLGGATTQHHGRALPPPCFSSADLPAPLGPLSGLARHPRAIKVWVQC